MSIVQGTDSLFTMSLRENILLDGQASQEEFETVLKVVGAEKFLHDLPNEVKTHVEKGEELVRWAKTADWAGADAHTQAQGFRPG